MELFVLLAVVVTVIGVALAAYGRSHGTIGGIEERPGDEERPDQDAGRESFEQIIDDRGQR